MSGQTQNVAVYAETPDAFAPFRHLAAAVIRQAVADAAVPFYATSVHTFLTRSLWEPGNLWADWLGPSLPRRSVILAHLGRRVRRSYRRHPQKH